MKKYFLLLVLVSLAVGLFALDKQRVMVKQYPAISGGPYAMELSVPELPTGKINLKYTFTVDAKDDEHAVIDCIVKFPNYVDVEFLACEGVQGISLKDDGTVAGLSIYTDGSYKCCEFLIPQKNNGEGSVEFQVDILDNFVGRDIPVEFNFEHLKKPLLKRYGTAVGIATGIAAGIVIGVVTFNPAVGTAAGAAAGTATTVATTAGLTLLGSVAVGTGAGLATAAATTVVSYNAIRESLQEIKAKYHSSKMNDSYKRFTLQIKG